MSFTRGRPWGMLLLAVWLILFNALPLLKVRFPVAVSSWR